MPKCAKLFSKKCKGRRSRKPEIRSPKPETNPNLWKWVNGKRGNRRDATSTARQSRNRNRGIREIPGRGDTIHPAFRVFGVFRGSFCLRNCSQAARKLVDCREPRKTRKSALWTAAGSGGGRTEIRAKSKLMGKREQSRGNRGILGIHGTGTGLGLLPRHFRVRNVLHLLINVRRCQNVPNYFQINEGQPRMDTYTVK